MFTIQDAVANTATTTIEAVKTGQTMVLDAVNTMANLVPADLGSVEYLPAQMRAGLPADVISSMGVASPQQAMAQYASYLDTMFDFSSQLLELNKSFTLAMMGHAESFRPTGEFAAPFADGLAAMQTAFNDTVERATSVAQTQAEQAQKVARVQADEARKSVSTAARAAQQAATTASTAATEAATKTATATADSTATTARKARKTTAKRTARRTNTKKAAS